MTTATRALAIVLAMATAAHAQSPEAEALFREGKKLMKEKAFAAACEKFEASERLEARIGAELNLADCRERTGQIASAWAMFIRAAQTAKHTGDKRREMEAKRRAAALEPRLVYLTISVPRPSRIAGLVVHRNDIVVDLGLYDQAVPVDPDEYQITAAAPGHESWQRTIAVGKTNVGVEVPRLAEVIAPAPPLRTDAAQVRAQAPSSWTTRRKAAVAVGVLGVALGATGIAFGLHANDLESQSDEICPTVRCTDATAIDLNHRARTNGAIATVGMIGGSVMVAGAIALWIFGGAAHNGVAIVPSVGPVGVAIGGTY